MVKDLTGERLSKVLEVANLLPDWGDVNGVIMALEILRIKKKGSQMTPQKRFKPGRILVPLDEHRDVCPAMLTVGRYRLASK